MSTTKLGFQCGQCKILFLKAYYLKTHVRTHSQNVSDEEKDDHYQMILDRTEYIEINKKDENVTEKPYECSDCGDNYFRFRINLVAHMKKHLSEAQFKCDQCETYFKTKFAMKDHKRMHTKSRLHKCEFCGKVFHSKSRLKAHTIIHTREKLYKCEDCEKGFDRKGDLNKHRDHLCVAQKPLKCKYCSKLLFSEAVLIDHIIKHHSKIHRENPEEIEEMEVPVKIEPEDLVDPLAIPEDFEETRIKDEPDDEIEYKFIPEIGIKTEISVETENRSEDQFSSLYVPEIIIKSEPD